MSLDYSRISAIKFIPPAEKKSIGKWLDQTNKAPNDMTKGKIYYNGVMGSKPLYILSTMDPMPYGVTKPGGGYYSNLYDYRIIVVLDNQSYDIRFELVKMELGQEKIVHNGRMVYCHRGYTITGIYPTEMNANDEGILSHLLWEDVRQSSANVYV
jgi:hypothetical protein